MPNVLLCLLFVSLVNACANYKFKKDAFLGRKHISALILARSGSKGIHLKNISRIGKTTLISNTLEKIQQVEFNSIWVSTNSAEIVNVLLSDHVNIHWRSEESATDTASSVFATQEFMKFHPEVDAVALIQCTSPFLNKNYLKQALNLLLHERDCVFAANRSFKLRWTVRKGKLIPLNFQPASRPRRQDWNGELVENGMFYFAKNSLIRGGTLQNNNCAVVEIPEVDSIEIDTPLDLVVANIIYEYRNLQN